MEREHLVEEATPRRAKRFQEMRSSRIGALPDEMDDGSAITFPGAWYLKTSTLIGLDKD